MTTNPDMSTEVPPVIGRSEALAGELNESSNPFWENLRSRIGGLQVAVVFLLVVAGDYLLYQSGGGYSGWAVWTVVTAALLGVGIVDRDFRSKCTWLMMIGFFLASWRLWWQGDEFVAFAVVMLMTWWILKLNRIPLEWWRILAFWILWIPSGLVALPAVFSIGWTGGGGSRRWQRVLEIGIPLFVCALFASIFLNANPESFAMVLKASGDYLEGILQWLRQFSIAEVFLWGLFALLSLGAFYSKEVVGIAAPFWDERQVVSKGSSNSVFGKIAFNTLVTLVALFAIYLVGEISSMWFREFPEGFHYSGYAHAGAAWLTLALAMTTVVLSVIFQGRWRDWAGSKVLLVVAKIWAAENLILAVCVFNRLWIYVQFNGMTRMRVVGFLGTLCVTVGLVLVVIKIQRNWRFIQLTNAQAWVVALAVFAAAIFPVDRFIHAYNSQRILAGSYAPSVQMHVQKISASGYLSLLPLVNSEEPIIRDGTRAMLAEYFQGMQRRLAVGQRTWRSYQYVDAKLYGELQEIESTLLAPYLESSGDRVNAIEDFRQFAMQWF